MRCPFCGFESSKVLESRSTDEGCKVKRRRECENCLKRFNTFEEIEQVPLMVIKKNGVREAFDKNKLMDGLLKSCEKRPISLEKIEKIANEIRFKAQNSIEKEIKAETLGGYAMDELKKVDEVAYIRFASVYRQFKDVQAFKKELENLLTGSAQ